MKLAGALLLAALAAGGDPGAAVPQGDPLAPLRSLTGACWIAAFPGGKLVDLQCFEGVEGGRFVRARHVLLGSDPLYSGEAVYYADRGKLAFIYMTSLGGVSRGDLAPQKDGHIAGASIHMAADGTELRMHGEMVPVDAHHYRMITKRWADGAWSAPFAADFRRLPGECATLELARTRCSNIDAPVSARE